MGVYAKMSLELLVYVGVLLSAGFYLGERLMPWFIAIIMGALSGILFLAAGFYWTVSDATIPVYGWLWTLWGVINLILVTYFSIGLMRSNQGAYPSDEKLYGDAV